MFLTAVIIGIKINQQKERTMSLAKIGFIFCAVVLLGLGNGFAQEDGLQAVKEEFKKIDINNDGAITPEEMQAYQEKKLQALDTDNSGSISKSELAADSDMEKILHNADTNNDAEVSPEESSSQFKKYFEEIDADKDNKISEVEYTDYWKLRMQF